MGGDCRWELEEGDYKWEGNCRWGLQEGDCEWEVGVGHKSCGMLVEGDWGKVVNVHFKLTNSCLKFENFVSCIRHFCIIK